MPVTAAPKKRERMPDFEPDLLLDFEMPARAVRLGKSTQALVDMDVDPKKPMFFKRPPGIPRTQWGARVSSWMNAARRNGGGTYVRRMVEFENEDGVAVWRLK